MENERIKGIKVEKEGEGEEKMENLIVSHIPPPVKKEILISFFSSFDPF